MPRSPRSSNGKPSRQVDALAHKEATRRNIPTAEMETFFRSEEDQAPRPPKHYPRARTLAEGETRTQAEPGRPELIWNSARITISAEQMKELAETGTLALSETQLVWRGKDRQDWTDLVVNVPPLYIQEKIHPKAIIDDLMRRTAARRDAETDAPDLFVDFNGITPEQRAEFYQHDQRWSNRMILGDSLQVMAGLAERESLRGKVQCIYFDPPYGIKFNSNWQVSTQSRDVKDGKQTDISREPEQVKAFRDTWKDGIHSYLTYLRDRLTVMRDLLTESGSIFVQIGDENVHRVRAVMDEVFGPDNFVSQIGFAKTSGLESVFRMPATFDYLLWYSRRLETLKYRPLWIAKGNLEKSGYTHCLIGGDERPLSSCSEEALKIGTIYARSDLTKPGPGSKYDNPFRGRIYTSGKRWWGTTPDAMLRLAKADRISPVGNNLRFRRFLQDNPTSSLRNLWEDTGIAGFASDKVYVVETNAIVIERCVLMTTDPGDLVLDPTCGSGTTAYVAEQWGRRWITIDTSRVALALARTRLMAARYPWYLLADSREGRAKEAELTRRVPAETPVHNDLRQGFVYERVPHITLKSIANNPQIDDVWEKWQQVLEPLRAKLNAALGKSCEEWQIPRELPAGAPASAGEPHARWWEARIARQREIDASIAARADVEYLYDKPYIDNARVRVAGPFTVESLSPHRVLPASKDDLIADIDAAEGKRSPADADLAGQDFAAIVIDYLKAEGVRQQAKGDRITFESLAPWPGNFIGAGGTFTEGENGPERRAAILIGPEYGTVGRQDIVAAAREAVDAHFDVLIACAFNFDALSSELGSLGSLKIIKARINPDMHMSDELKNTGRGNMFVVFGEPDVEVASGLWLVTGAGRLVVNHERLAKFSGLGSLEEINRLGGSNLSRLKRVATGREVRADQPAIARSGLRAGEQSRGAGDPSDDRGAAPVSRPGLGSETAGAVGRDRSNALGPDEIVALEALNPGDFPLRLTTGHWTQITIHGVDVFDPNTGDIRSNDTAGIAAWFIDTDYNEESFFVRHAYFLGANDPYKSLKTALQAEIDEDAWATLYSATSRPFERPESGHIAVKVINHFGDEVMKVFRV